MLQKQVMNIIEKQFGEILRKEIEKAIDEKRVDSQESQQYNSPQLIMIADLSEEEWHEMKKKGAKELRPYYNESRNTWHIALSLGYDENHKRMRKVITGKTQEEVYQRYFEFKNNNKVLEAETADDTNIKNNKSQMLFKDYINYVLELSKTTIRESSLKVFKDMSKYIIKDIGTYRMCQLNKEVLNNFLNELANKTYTKGGVTSYYSSEIIGKVYQILKKCIYKAYKEHIIPENYMEEILKPKSKKLSVNEKNKPLPDNKIKEIQQALNDEPILSIYFRLLLETGVRPSEALALQFTDIDYENGIISINKTVTYKVNEVKKGDKVVTYRQPIIGNVKNYREGNNPYAHRKIEISDDLLTKIKKYENSIKSSKEIMNIREKNHTVENIFTGQKQQLVMYPTFNKRFKKYLEKKNVSLEGYTIYSTRHTFATNLAKQQVDLKSIQILLGDIGSEMVVRTYTNIDKEHATAISGKYNKIMSELFN